MNNSLNHQELLKYLDLNILIEELFALLFFALSQTIPTHKLCILEKIKCFKIFVLREFNTQEYLCYIVVLISEKLLHF